MINNIPHKSQAHCLVTQSDSYPKPAKELALPTHEQTEIKHETLTWYIKHLAESANFKGSTFNKHCNGLIGNRFEMPNVSYTHPSDCLKT
jgi:hypothetical protein